MAGHGARLLATATAIAAASAVLTFSPPSRAQAADAGFGNRDAFVLSVERIAGFQSQDFGGNSGSIDTLGFQPLYWGGLGLFGVWETGLTLGALIGATRIDSEIFGDENETITLLQLRPRIGYAGTLQKNFGFWVRGGPTYIMAFSDDEDEDASRILALGGELYAVITPVPHVGILFGPHAEFHVTGTDDDEYSSYGLTLGLMGEFW